MCAMFTTGSRSSLTMYLKMKEAFLITRLCHPAPPATDSLMLALSPLLYKRSRNGELQSKSEFKEEYCPSLGSCRAQADIGAHQWDVASQELQLLHLPPRMGCTHVFKLHVPNPCAHPSSLTSVPMGMWSPHPSCCSGTAELSPTGCMLLWDGLAAKGQVTLQVWLKLCFAKSFHSAGSTWPAENLLNWGQG